jgi:ElaB/YqjD/DUF883 family membrane-anchored ribosome-binding protein
MDLEEVMTDEVEMPEEFVEDEDIEEEDVEELVDTTEEAEEQPEPEAKAEPGYVQKRIDKALRQQRDSMKAEIMAEMEAQYAPIRDRLLEMDAQELVRQGEFKSIERAKEYLQLKQGIAPQEEPQPRNEQGQFMSQSEAIEMARTEERIEMLKVQAANIKEDTGLDVIAEWNRNPEVKQAVMDGEMDFYQVAKQMQKKRPPSPMRSPNGVNGVGPQSITSMSDAQFKKLDQMLDQGVRFTIKR